MIDVLSCLGSRGKVMLARGPMSGCPEVGSGMGLQMNMDLTGARGIGTPGWDRAKTALVLWTLESPASGGSPSQVPLACILSKRWLGKSCTRGVAWLGTCHSCPVPSVPTPPLTTTLLPLPRNWMIYIKMQPVVCYWPSVGIHGQQWLSTWRRSS